MGSGLEREQVENACRVPTIRLRGEPYQRTVGGERVDCSVTLDKLAETTGYLKELPAKVAQVEPLLKTLFEGGGFYEIGGKLTHGQDLSFAEAFSLATFVCAALNNPLYQEVAQRIPTLKSRETHLLQATALLSAMSAKESFSRLTPLEIAGMVAATIHLDTVLRINSPGETIAFGGMGGDKGYSVGGRDSKLFSVSTLSAIALAVDGPTHKHHSYPNTSKIAGQSAIEAFGARSDFHSPQAFERILKTTGLVMTSCHDTRTLHTLSHSLKGETINHVIGPLSFTLCADTPIQAMVGVNEKIHPGAIIEALKILHTTGFQRYGNSTVYFGTDLQQGVPELLSLSSYYRSRRLKGHIAIDEVAPPPYVTIASFLVNGRNAGSYVLYPEDFYTPQELSRIPLSALTVPNTEEAIIEANRLALSGKDEAKTRYLAMTIGLGLFVRHFLRCGDALRGWQRRVNSEYLRYCTKRALEIIHSGGAESKLQQYVAATQKYAGGRL